MAKIHVNTTINGSPTEFLCDANQTLLDVLRDTLGLTGSKEGDRKSTRLNSSHVSESRMPSSA